LAADAEIGDVHRSGVFCPKITIGHRMLCRCSRLRPALAHEFGDGIPVLGALHHTAFPPPLLEYQPGLSDTDFRPIFHPATTEPNMWSAFLYSVSRLSLPILWRRPDFSTIWQTPERGAGKETGWDRKSVSSRALW
jgi:hypothetical protein